MGTIERGPEGLTFQLDDRRWPLRQILCIGLNYAPHAGEQGLAAPAQPVVFSKNLAAAALHGEEILVPSVCQDRPQVDYEGELAVVIGSVAREVSEDEALACVAGFCCANDVSARHWQKQGAGGQFFRGKSFDTFCPLGPRLASVGELGDVQALTLTTRVNGERRQHASTAEMIFPVARLIADLSRGMTLLPGTVLLTGTPAGVGFAHDPPRFLADGDVIEVEIEGIGVLRNTVRITPRS